MENIYTRRSARPEPRPAAPERDIKMGDWPRSLRKAGRAASRGAAGKRLPRTGDVTVFFGFDGKKWLHGSWEAEHEIHETQQIQGFQRVTNEVTRQKSV